MCDELKDVTQELRNLPAAIIESIAASKLSLEIKFEVVGKVYNSFSDIYDDVVRPNIKIMPVTPG